MKITTWSVINNEIEFLPELLAQHLPWVDYLYFLDTGSTDGTIEYLQAQQLQYPEKIIVEQYHAKYIPQYDVEWREMHDPFPEVEVRNYALQRVEELLKLEKTDWLIQLDGDEIFSPLVRNMIIDSQYYTCIGHSSLNPVAALKDHPMERRGGHTLFDPHVRIWKAGQGIRYQSNPVMKGRQFHCLPTLNGKHLFHHPLIKFVDQPIHFHLHWMFGKKMEIFFKKKGLSSRQDMAAQQSINELCQTLPETLWAQRQAWIQESP